MNDWDEYYADEGHKQDIRSERKRQLAADGPYDDYEFVADTDDFWEEE